MVKQKKERKCLKLSVWTKLKERKEDKKKTRDTEIDISIISNRKMGGGDLVSLTIYQQFVTKQN